MQSDIVERLRGVATWGVKCEAADEIERLRAELDAEIQRRIHYRSALERIANEDYRGNRSNESQIAFDALAAADSLLAAMRKGVARE